ncbi:MAG: hypothetical protein HGB21_08300 [Nitrospirae bacterium]|nr:hypothetical protein [Nitrospirota bacterium]NTW66289.1 hypothetical protein [Nitrospirota bacterium]
MKECPPDQVQIAREILDHLSRQPGEEDTLEGIMLHRLPEKPAIRQITLIQEVVADLVTQGLVEKITKEGRTRYRVKSRL